MRHRLFSLCTVISGILLLCLLFSGTSFGMEKDKLNFPTKIGLINLSRIKAEAPKYIKLREEFEVYDYELEEYTAGVLSEHFHKLKELTAGEVADKDDYQIQDQGDYYFRAQELAAETQKEIDSKKEELAKIRGDKEQALTEELRAVVQKVAKKKAVDCVLLESGIYVGGIDLTDDIIKTWEKWDLTFWQKVRRFFKGK